MDHPVVSETFDTYENSVGRAMTAGGAAGLLGGGRPVMLKPNIVNASPHPVTPPPALCAAVIAFVRQHTDAPIVIAEGCGDAAMETGEVFTRLGYDRLAPPKHYNDGGGSWKKAALHQHLDEAIVELNLYRSPDITVMDATVGLINYRLGGASCEPPANRILAGLHAREVDREAAGLLGMDWRYIVHLI